MDWGVEEYAPSELDGTAVFPHWRVSSGAILRRVDMVLSFDVFLGSQIALTSVSQLHFR
jgi:hypothetical protein